MQGNKIKQQFFIGLCLALLALVSVPGFTWAQRYTEPTGPPPQTTPSGRSAIEFLNGSTAEQRKAGSFVLGVRNGRLPNCTTTDSSGCSALCLNGNPANGANDTKCIRDWSDITFFVGGPFLRKLTTAQASEIDLGFVSLRSNPFNQQLISFIGEANPAVNGSIGIRAESTSTSNYAGQFSGRVVVRRTVGNAALCLHGNCITSWPTAIPAPADALALQTIDPYNDQSANIDVSGLIVADSIIGGFPSTTTSTVYTCGDALCSAENSETTINCAADCQ